MDVQTFREKLMLTILSGLMLRHDQPGYSDLYAIHEAYNLSETWCKEAAAQTSEQAESPATPVNIDYAATLEESFGVLNRMCGVIQACTDELQIVIDRLNSVANVKNKSA